MANVLNPRLFYSSDNKYFLKNSVRVALYKIAIAFSEFIEDNGIVMNIADIRLVGSNAGYDYTEHSDIDLHIVCDFEAISCDIELLQVAFNSQRSIFNQSHDISVKGIPVELYVEDVKSGISSEGIYSILYDKWIKYPSEPAEIDLELDELCEESTLNWINIIQKCLERDDANYTQRVLNRLYMMRKNGLDTEGQNSLGNCIFKRIRNLGYLDKLKSARDSELSRNLTLESKLLERMLRRDE